MRKYISPITRGLTPDNWQDKINLASLSLDDVIDLLGDLKAMEAFGKKVGGFIKEAVKAKMPEGETEHIGKHFHIQLNTRVRVGGLNKVKVLEDMGEAWVEEYSNPPTEYVELRLKRIEEET